MKDPTFIEREIYAAETYLTQEMANAAKPFIRCMVSRHAFSLPEDRPRHLTWLRGIWMGGHRGMILTANDQPVLWAAVEAPATGAISERLGFNLHFVELANRRGG